jgi:5-hydroxyisourate hydrolase-like protein (transthyretin family)
VPVQSAVQINIYDVSGRLVSTLINNEKFEPGIHSVRFNGNNLPSGMYFYRFKTESYIETRKMLLVK